MWQRLRQMLVEWFSQPPVTWSDIEYVTLSIQSVDRDIEFVRLEQLNTRDVYMFASMDFQIQYLLQRRVQLSIARQDLLNRARRQGPLVDSDLYSKVQ